MTMNCLQTLAEKGPEISCMHFDLSNRQIVIANNKLEVIAVGFVARLVKFDALSDILNLLSSSD
jgi:hypothetical protein